MRGGSWKLLLWVSVFACVVAFVLLIATPRQRPAIAAEPVQSTNSEVSSQLESLSARIQELTLEFQCLNQSLRQHAVSPADQKQLADQMNQLSLAQSNTWFVVQRLASRSPESLESESPEQWEQQHQAKIKLLGEVLKDLEKVVREAMQRIQELASSVPAEVRNLDIESGLEDPTLKQYWPFFRERVQYNDNLRLRQLLDYKLAEEQVKDGSTR